MATKAHLRVLRLLQVNPHMALRELAGELGASLGDVNHCIKEPLLTAPVRMQNVSNSRNKISYPYLLTTVGRGSQGAANYRIFSSLAQQGALQRGYQG